MRLLRIFALIVALQAPFVVNGLTIGDKLEDGLGVSLPWQKGIINIRFANQRFQIYFLDAEGKIIAPNVEAASVRYAPSSLPQNFTYAAMSPSSSGDSLISSFYVPPPHYYYVTIIFFKKENGKTRTLKTFDPVYVTISDSKAEGAGASQKNNPCNPCNPCSIFGSNAKPAKNSSNPVLGPNYQKIEGTKYQ